MTMTLTRRLFMMAACVLAAVSCIYDDSSEEEFELKVGDRIPDFTVKMTDGTEVTGASLRNGVSLIMFFHTDCPDCQGTLPSVQRIYDEFLDEGVSFALISRSQLKKDIQPYWDKQGYTMPYSPQEDRAVYNLFATSRVPRVYICKDGVIMSFYTDDPIPTYEELYSDISHLFLRQ